MASDDIIKHLVVEQMKNDEAEVYGEKTTYTSPTTRKARDKPK
jgi:hypothetical protein